MRRMISVIVVAALMAVLVASSAVPAFAADNSPTAGSQSADVCGGQGNSVGAIVPVGSGGITPSSGVSTPVGAGCSSGCSSTKGQR